MQHTAGKWLAKERGAMEVEEVKEFVAVQPEMFPLADRLSAESLVTLFEIRERLPPMKNAPHLVEACGA